MATIENLLHRRSDLSTFLVHFTRDGVQASALDNLVSILQYRVIEARTVLGMARDLVAEFPSIADSQKVACFTETPLEHAWMMCEDIEDRQVRFNGYGVAFTKTFARRKSVNPVWYIDITRPPGEFRDWLTNAVNQLVREARESAQSEGELQSAPILRLTPFYEQMGPIGAGRKEFWWEREWRHVGDFTFMSRDIVVVYAPESDHEYLKNLMRSWQGGYVRRTPAVIDARWGLERVIGTLAEVSDLGPFPN